MTDTPKALTGRKKSLANLTGGSRKGKPNKITADVKAMVLEALSEVGGAQYLARQARKRNPAPFMALVGKVLPMQVEAELNHTGGISVTIQQF